MSPLRKTTSCLLGVCALSACDATAPDVPRSARIESVTTLVATVPGYRKQVDVRIVDGAGAGLPGVSVRFELAPDHGTVNDRSMVLEAANGAGIASVVWRLPTDPGDYDLVASVITGGGVGPAGPEEPTLVVPARVESFSPTLDRMLQALGDRIAAAVARERQSLPLNPHLDAEIRERIGLLEERDLDSRIVAERRFHEHETRSLDGRMLPVATVFPASGMRAEAELMGPVVEGGLGVVEALLAPFPTDDVRIWYGFGLGARGGGGQLEVEDRGTYLARSGPLPYDAVVYHEMAHSYIGNESVTQLVELIVYNRVRTGSTSLGAWPYTRGWPGLRDENENLHALLDIYHMIGYDGVARGLRSLLPLPTPYGQPLCVECVQAFVDEAPHALREMVRTKAERVRF